jgi:nitrous oxide reductase accessory protein NosL
MRSSYSVPRFALLLLLAALITMGCEHGEAGPPELLQDKTACARCKMLIGETEYAAAYSSQGAPNARVFDDIGCMLQDIADAAAKPSQIWVRDFANDQWLDARQAYYVQSPELKTPMAYHFVALIDEDAANAAAAEYNGKMIGGYEALDKSFWSAKQ